MPGALMKDKKEELMFVFDEPALVIEEGGRRYLVVGDLHIGLEAKLREKGVHVYGLAEKMAERIRLLMEEFNAGTLIILGDVKDSILYSDSYEAKSIKSFFRLLDGVDIRIAEGNHDAHLGEMITLPREKEIILGKYALLHGNAFPDERAMVCDYIITAHNHVSVSIKDIKGTVYRYKAWMISKVSKNAGKYYDRYKKNSRLISMPAFNELIIGTGVEQFSKKDNLNPLLRNGIFEYTKAEVYLLNGDRVGTLASIRGSGFIRS